MLRLTFLGTSAAQPTIQRNLTGLAVRRERELFLVDCGEGTQRQMIRYGTGFDVDAIFFTHFHADHYIGAIGFLRTLSMLGRDRPLDLYGPRPAKRLLDVMLFTGTDPLGYYMAPWAYSQLQVIAQAVQATNSLDDQKIADYIRANTFSTVLGDVKFGGTDVSAKWDGIFGTQFLAAVYRFRGDATVYWIYNFKLGSYYPFVPAGGQQRDASREFRLRSLMEKELPLEKDEAKWYPMWGLPL